MSEPEDKMPQSKKQKLDDAEKNPVVYFDPKRIPIEVWESIFIHNSARDLLNLSLVCKKFYNAIGSLPEAMDKIVVKQGRKTKKDKNSLLNSSRNYKNFEFERIKIIPDTKISLQIVRMFGENLRSLKFYLCHFIEEEFNKILEMSQKNLRSLTIYGLGLKETTQKKEIAAPRSFKLTNLQSLTIHSGIDSVFIKNILDCAPDILLEVVCAGIIDSAGFVNFLEKQKNLKHLSLNSAFMNFPNNTSSAQFKFQLEKLEIKLPYDINSNKNFVKFLKSQAESLKELTLQNMLVNEFYDAFSNMPNLRLLKVKIRETITTEEYETGPNFDCPALKSLEIDIEEYNSNLSFFNFFKRFATIQEIVLKMHTNSEIVKIIAENHPNLKSLVIYYFSDGFFNSLSFKNLKKLEIFNHSETHEITMLNSIFAMENLEILKIGFGFYLTVPSLLLILFNFKKLEHLEIDNGSYLSDDLLCRHLEFFKNLRSLKIGNMRDPVVKFIQCLAVYPDLKYSFSSGSWNYCN